MILWNSLVHVVAVVCIELVDWDMFSRVGQFLSEVGGDGYRYRLLDEEDCAEFTDVYWIKFSAISNAR